MTELSKVLIIRLSSLGDIVQALEVPTSLKSRFAQSQVHWLVRKDLEDLPLAHPDIDQVFSLERNSGFRGLFQLIQKLKKENYDALYDAHSNLRSHLICFFLNPKYFIRRPKFRLKRLLLFTFNINLFPKPFRGTLSYLEPLKPWGLTLKLSTEHQLRLPVSTIDFKGSILLAPSAAWELKRWPLEYWKELTELLAPYPLFLLGGPDDQFCNEIEKMDPQRIKNLAGKLSWAETTAAISESALTVSGDTGALHIADFLAKKTIALIGPTAFGFPSRPHSMTLEVNLDCRPCTKDGRGECKNKVYQKCLRDITPPQVNQAARQLLESSPL